jgi:hypothetical protein
MDLSMGILGLLLDFVQATITWPLPFSTFSSMPLVFTVFLLTCAVIMGRKTFM